MTILPVMGLSKSKTFSWRITRINKGESIGSNKSAIICDIRGELCGSQLFHLYFPMQNIANN